MRKAELPPSLKEATQAYTMAHHAERTANSKLSASNNQKGSSTEDALRNAVQATSNKDRALRDIAKAGEIAPLAHNGMTHARKQLEKETERGEHKPAVAGYKDHNHTGSPASKASAAVREHMRQGLDD